MNQANPSLSENLRVMYDDMMEDYNEAKINDNAAGMERLTKIIRDLTKQIKEQETHERETIPRKEAIRVWGVLAMMVGKRLKERFGDDAAELLVDIVLDGEELINHELKA